MRLVEETSADGPFLGIVYDDLQRRSWAARAERGDATMDMAAESQKADEHILGQARTRLHGLLAEAGLHSRGSHSSPAGPMLGGNEQALSNQLAQQRAATESMMKRSAEASRDLMASADATRMRNDALAGGSPAKGKDKGKGKGQGGGQSSKRQQKSEDWFRKVVAKKGARKGKY